MPTIGRMVSIMQRVIVENHPRLLSRDHLMAFVKDIQPAQLEVAMGLETVHPEVLGKLNKSMTIDDFRSAVNLCHELTVNVRAFVLLQTPWLSRLEGIQWCQRSIEAAIDMGVQHISIIPVRDGNGTIERLAGSGEFIPPTAAMLEEMLEKNLSHTETLVTVDLWDWDKLRGRCEECSQPRKARLNEVNLYRRVLPTIRCERCDDSSSRR